MNNPEVIILDDDDAMLMLLRFELKHLPQLTCKLVNNVDDFKLCITGDLQIIVTDHYVYSKLTGLDMVKFAKEKNKDNVIIAFTVSKEPHIKPAYLAAGAVHFIDKDRPEFIEVLLDCILKALEVAKNIK